jgi:uncharacterized membrane protein YedE/YeeE
MPQTLARTLVAFGVGVIFAVGLAISGMTLPEKVVDFLDVTGDWDPSLALVMIGAIGVHAVGYRLVRRRPSPLLNNHFSVPNLKQIDARLLGGSALFGLGWGLGGFCPGPAVTSLLAGNASVLVFTASMLAGMGLYAAWDAWTARSAVATAPALIEQADA